MNHTVWAYVHPTHVEVAICHADEPERHCGLSSALDEMWAYVGKKAHQHWLWHAIDHHTGQVLAYVFGRRTEAVLLRLQVQLEPFGITRDYTDGRGDLRAAGRCRATHRWEGAHAEARASTSTCGLGSNDWYAAAEVALCHLEQAYERLQHTTFRAHPNLYRAFLDTHAPRRD